MDHRGGCCIARYSGVAYDMSKVDRIMLRFRPIAPKPASTNGSLSGGGSSGSTTPENSCPSVKTGRGKRRHAAKDGSNSTVNKRNCNSRRRKSSPENTDSGGSVSGGEKVVKTLPLLPEAPEVKESPKVASKQGFPLWLSFGNGGSGGEIVAPGADRSGLDDPTVPMGRMVVVGSWVKVECVTDTWVVGCYGYDGIGRTDEERVRSLNLDTCPGSYRRPEQGEVDECGVQADGGGGRGREGEVAAWLVMEEGGEPAGGMQFVHVQGEGGHVREGEEP
ncbi:UNVERIFIED_CONTAM: hypothetical protein Sradi_1063400 [Sesamum radiatum]|uniref:DUF7950 domain-containing protein n=1 Tax=Sesamum radiatum TaxID=300843 RepID=A0AAW2V771_SESRA